MRAAIGSERLIALTDGVVAVIITIMVLELKPPHGADFAGLGDLGPTFLSFLLSFVYVAIYRNNHHHFSAPCRMSTARSCGRTSTCSSGSR